MRGYMNHFKLDEFETIFTEGFDGQTEDSVYVVIIYDITNNKARVKFAKFLLGYGFRVQKSAFEAKLTHKKYTKLIGEIPRYISSDDSVRLYKIIGRGQVLTWGADLQEQNEEIIII